MFSKDVGYMETLEAMEGYVLNRIVATTYSLEPQLVFLLGSMFQLRKRDIEHLEPDIIKSLANHYADQSIGSILKEDRLLIFYQEDKFSYTLNQPNEKVALLLEHCCIPVEKVKPAFHPKIILAEYISDNDANEFVHRLVVSSRNLTRSNAFETQVVLERKVDEPLQKTQCDSYEGMKQYFEIIEAKEWNLIHYLEGSKINFESCTAKVYYQSANNHHSLFKEMHLEEEQYEKVILSPFYTGLERIKNATYYTVPDKESTMNGRNNVLHSKLFCVAKHQSDHNEESCGGVDLWVGSANCTRTGLDMNDECMVALTFEMSDTKSFISEFRKWLEDKGFVGYHDESVSTEGSNNQNIVEELVSQAEITADVVQCSQNPQLYNLVFKLEGNALVKLNLENIEVRTPRIKKKQKIKGNKNFYEVVFEGLSVEELSKTLVIQKMEGSQMISRIALAECSEELEKILHKNKETSIESKNKSILPDVLPDTPSGGKRNLPKENPEDGKNTQSYKIEDQEYEKLIKWYAAPGGKAILRWVYNNLNKKPSSENEVEDVVKKWIKNLINVEGHKDE